VTLRLTVDSARWRDHVDRVARRSPGLIPVIKGNGYGFGRRDLAPIAVSLSDTIAVGTVHELGGLPAGVTPVVLTPTVRPPDDIRAVLTVGSVAHVEALAGWRGRVVVKLASSVRRFGASPDELGALIERVREAGLTTAAFAVHPPVDGTDDEHADEIARWLDVLALDDEVWVSHLSVEGYGWLRDAWPDRRFRIRLGTALWHGDGKPALHLGADVLEVRRVRAGDAAGYHRATIDADGSIVVVGAGTAHGVHPLAGARSPFHFARCRLALVEPPHMHSSMVFVPINDEVPAVGDVLDVQRPLISTNVDTVVWR